MSCDTQRAFPLQVQITILADSAKLTAVGETADLLDAVRDVVRLRRGACGTLRFDDALRALDKAWMKATETHDAVGGSGS